MLNRIAPFFIVDNLEESLDFYCSKLGFQVSFTAEDFFGIVERDGVMIMLKAIAPEIHPQPNPTRHEWARWDAYVYTPDPDALCAEYAANHVPMRSPLSDTNDGLRAFEIADNSGYVICFGRPLGG